jgi:L-2-hydroxyglutarate oxidase LhgO
VGLAVARAFALAGRTTLILEGEPRFGSGVSARNSEVLHAGLYYPSGSLKAELCVRGRALAYAFCEARGVPFRRTGKLIFAHAADQAVALDVIEAQAVAAGVHDLRRLTGAEVLQLEPALRCREALLSPSTGIIDSHAFMTALLADAEAHGAVLACNSRVERVERRGERWAVVIDGMTAVAAPILVNCAGLGAQGLAAMTEGLVPEHIPPLRLARGVYFAYTGRVPFTRLIYPLPEPGGLGTHLTLDLAGRAKFGPDVEWIDRVDYAVDASRHARFVAAARRIWPELEPSRLVPAYAGIRPKLCGPGEPPADFCIAGPNSHGLAGLVALFGIESPGLTASMAIAERVLALLDGAPWRRGA